MKEILLTSSVLILALILLRLLFRNKVRRSLIYGAWLLVALRLLIPIQFGSLSIGVLSQAEPVTDAIAEVVQKPVSGPSREEIYTNTLQDYLSQGRPIFRPEVQEQVESEIQHSGRPAQDVYDALLESNPPENILLPEVNQQIKTAVSETVKPTIGQIATAVWIVGMAVMALWFVGVNVSFRQKLRRSAAPLDLPDCKIPVKVSSLLASPCLFGLLRPTVYLTPGCVGDGRKQRHVLTHELTHLRHGDHLWAWVRCLCLCVYWFNPLVWVAASLSRRDCELACDEAALKTLGEQERLAYGKTLVDMVSSLPAPGQLLETATAMHETKKQLKERVTCIVKKPKVFLSAAILLLLVLTFITGCAFSGVGSKPTEDTDPTTVPTTAASDPTTDPTTEPTTAPTTVPPTTETVPPTTEQKPVFLSMEDITLPSQSAELPENPTPEDLLEPYTGSALWYSTGDEYSVTVELPLLTPFCDGAKAINEKIRDRYQPKIDSIQDAYAYDAAVFDKAVSYEVYRNGDVLSLIITGDTYLDWDYYDTFNLDLATGQELSKYDMIQRFAGVSYPEFLLHATYSVYNDPDLQHSGLLGLLENDPLSMSGYELALDGSGRLMLYGHLSQMMCSTVTPYDPDAWGWDKEYTDWERGSYMWLFQRKTDGAYADALASLFAESFFLDPEGFLKHLSLTTAEINEHVADFVVYALHPEELSYFETLCGQYLFKDDTAKAARALLDAYKKNRSLELGTLETLFQQFTDGTNYFNYAIGQEYTSPTELNLRYFFDHGFADERTPTEAELTELKQHIDEWWVEMADFYRLPKDKMNEVLQTYFGITLADLPDTAYEGLTYLESTDCYYFFATGVFGVAEYFEALSVKHLDSSTVQLTYTKMAYPQWNFVVTIEYIEDGYRILSNTYAPGITEDPDVMQFINRSVLNEGIFADNPATADSMEFHDDCTITVRYTMDNSGERGTLILKVLYNRLEILSNTLDGED